MTNNKKQPSTRSEFPLFIALGFGIITYVAGLVWVRGDVNVTYNILAFVPFLFISHTERFLGSIVWSYGELAAHFDPKIRERWGEAINGFIAVDALMDAFYHQGWIRETLVAADSVQFIIRTLQFGQLPYEPVESVVTLVLIGLFGLAISVVPQKVMIEAAFITLESLYTGFTQRELEFNTRKTQLAVAGVTGLILVWVYVIVGAGAIA